MVGIKMLWWKQDFFILTEAMQDSFEIGHIQYVNIGSEAFRTNFYIWWCSFCIQVSFGK